MATRRQRRERREQQSYEALSQKLEEVEALHRAMLADAAALPPARVMQAAATRRYAVRLEAILNG